MKRVFGFFIDHPERTCPRCGSVHVHRTKRGRILQYRVLFFLSVRPDRCGKCRLRFYGPKEFIDDIQPDDFAETAAADDAARLSRRDWESSRSSRD